MAGATFQALSAYGLTGNDSFTKILLHMDGANAGTTFIDSNFGGAAKTWTAGGSATTSTTQSKFGTSASLPSTSWVETPDSTDFTVGAGDFTVDFWFYVSGGAGANRYAFGQLDSGGAAANFAYYLALTAANVWSFGQYTGASVLTTVTGTTTFTTTGWHHVAGVRASNVMKLFVDGVQEGGNVSNAGTGQDSPNKFSVGRAGEFAGQTWNGFIDEFRLSVGIARWTANFNPPANQYG